MDSPFIYDRYVTGKNFIGRRNDCQILSNLLSQGEHVTLYAPPKSGKTSLIQQTLVNMRIAGVQFLVGNFSVLNIRTVEDFLKRMGSTVIRMVASTPEEYADIVRNYLEGSHFVFDPRAFSEKDELLSLNWDMEPSDIDAVLSLPFKIASTTGKRMILIIDEFQDLGMCDNPDMILRRMDAVMKDAKEKGLNKLSLVLCGSSVNAMKEIFEKGFLFYRYVEKLSLSTVPEGEITDHIVKGFLASGKVSGKDLFLGACSLLKNNLWYLNHFAAICDSMTKGYIMEPVLVDALNCLIAIHEPRFRYLMDSLTTHQVSLLRATVEGVTRFSAADVIRRYNLNSSANVKRVKDALMKKEILSFDETDTPSFMDPLFEYWVRKYYFEIND